MESIRALRLRHRQRETGLSFREPLLETPTSQEKRNLDCSDGTSTEFHCDGFASFGGFCKCAGTLLVQLDVLICWLRWYKNLRF